MANNPKGSISRETIMADTKGYSVNSSIENEKLTIERIQEIRQKAFDEYNKYYKSELIKSVKEVYALESKLQIAGIESKKKADKLVEKAEKARKLELEAELHRERIKLSKAQAEATKDYVEAALHDPTAKFGEKLKAFGKGFVLNLKEGAGKAVGTLVNGALNLGATLSKDVDEAMDKYARYSQSISTRLQGRGERSTFKDIREYYNSTIGAASPFYKTEALYNNLQQLVNSGITYNIEQRAFLQTISSNIANTFSAFDSNLMRIIRLQQADSTASRLGMEAYITRFLNLNYQNTEYLSNAYHQVQGNLVEAMSKLGGEQGVEFEFQVQKWLGALYSLGMGSNAVTGIAQALGQLGAGDIEGLASNNLQNLIVMGAGRAGLNYSDLLTGGLNAGTTNRLMYGIIGYLKEVVELSKTNNVVASQFSKAFGVSFSDLNAVAHLTQKDLDELKDSTLSYQGTISELGTQMDQMAQRLTTEGLLQNLFQNARFQAGMNVATNPAAYALWKVTSMIDKVTSGIALPSVGVFGNFFDLNTSITNLMKTGIVGISSLGMIGDIIGGLGTVFSSLVGGGSGFSGALSKLGIGGTINRTTRGAGPFGRKAGMSTSVSGYAGYVGNASSGDIYGSTLANIEDIRKSETAKAKAEQGMTIDSYLMDIFDPKMDAVVTMLSHISGVNYKSVEGKSGGTTIQVEPPKDNTSNIDKVEKSLAEIMTILRGTLTVQLTQENMSELTRYRY